MKNLAYHPHNKSNDVVAHYPDRPIVAIPGAKATVESTHSGVFRKLNNAKSEKNREAAIPPTAVKQFRLYFQHKARSTVPK